MTEILWTGHVDDIDIADYLSGKMQKEERDVMKIHLVKCQPCMKTLLAAEKFDDRKVKAS